MLRNKILNWNLISNFSLIEFNKKHYPDAFMDEDFIHQLKYARSKIDKSFNIHEGFAKTGHAPNSFHYLGRACDMDISNLSLVEMSLQLFKHTDLSIGLYPGWNTPGIHVDNRNKRIFWYRSKKAYHYFTNLGDLLSFSSPSWYKT